MNEIKICDYDLVCYLFCMGYLYDRIIPQTQKRAEFVYIHSPSLQEEVDRFWQGQGLVEPKDFANARKTVKAHYENFLTSQYATK